MLFKLVLLLAPLAVALGRAVDWPFEETTISAPDGSIRAKFVPFGATLTELWVKDRRGLLRDVVLGYDDNSKLLSDPGHPVFNAIVGRYANRINNGTFSIPISKNPPPNGPNVYHIPTNDGNGQVTLHGGIYGWDRRNWTIASRSRTSVTFKHVDLADEGFPGVVTAYTTHTVSNGGVLHTEVRATASQRTPIMLTQHIYWNLDAFQDGSDTILNHTLKVPSSRVVALDNLAIPTGEFTPVAGTVFDFRRAQQIGSRWDKTVGLCRDPCQGYDHGWIYDRSASDKVDAAGVTATEKPGVSLWSAKSGIKLDISTNQPLSQVYTAYWLDTPRKAVHGGPSLTYSKWAAVAIEQEGYLAAINTPEWGIDQICECNPAWRDVLYLGMGFYILWPIICFYSGICRFLLLLLSGHAFYFWLYFSSHGRSALGPDGRPTFSHGTLS